MLSLQGQDKGMHRGRGECDTLSGDRRKRKEKNGQSSTTANVAREQITNTYEERNGQIRESTYSCSGGYMHWAKTILETFQGWVH